MRRNDPILNNYSRIAIERGRSNMDWQMVMDPVVCMEYVAKYTAKAEKASKECLKVMDAVVYNADPSQETSKTIRSMALKAAGRDFGATEIHFHNLGLPIVETNVVTQKFVSLIAVK